MRQGWKFLSLGAALTLVLAAVPMMGTANASSDSEANDEVVETVKKKTRLRQFTGYVTLIDDERFTVEKRTKKKTRSKSFAMHDEMRVRGDLVEDAKVTVYYRTLGKRAVAHRVVVKLPPVEDSEE